MNALGEGFTYFWEVLTGVYDEDRAKLIRWLCFFLLFAGIMWAALNYFRAGRISNLSEEFSPSDQPSASRDTSLIERATAMTEMIATMRNGGEAIAQQMSAMNRKPFNIEGLGEDGIGDISGSPTITVPEQPIDNRDNIVVKGLMFEGKNKYAVVDYAAHKGLIVRLGRSLPGDAGRVVRITREGITVRKNGREEKYGLGQNIAASKDSRPSVDFITTEGIAVNTH